MPTEYFYFRKTTFVYRILSRVSILDVSSEKRIVSCKSITFCNVSPDTFKRMKKKLQDADVQIPPGNKGKLSWTGIVADFEWDGKCNLTIKIMQKPLFISCDIAAYKIKKFVILCHGS